MPPCTWMFRLAHRSAAGAGQRGGHRRRVGELVAAGRRRPGGVPHGAGGELGGDDHVGAVVLHRLEHGDRTTELDALLRVVGAHVACTPGRRRPPRPTGSTRARSTSTRRAPVITVAGAPSRVTRALRRVGSRLGGDSIATPSPTVDDCRRRRRPARGSATRTRRRAPRRRRRRPTPSDTVTEPPSATAPTVEPSASPGRSRDRRASSPAAAITALATTVGTNGPGATARRKLLDHDDQLVEPVAGAAARPRAGAARASRAPRARPRTPATRRRATRVAPGRRRAGCASRRNCAPSRRASDGLR